MKLTVATTALAASISGVAESLSDSAGRSFHDVVEDTSLENHLDLADDMESQRKLTAKFRERRLSNMENGRTAHRIRDKLKNLQLRNRGAENGGNSAVVDEYDLGLFSRKLEENSNTTGTSEEEAFSNLDSFLALCEEGGYGFTCSCSNLNETAYSVDVFCSYDENICSTEEDGCGDESVLCFAKTYDLNLLAKDTGSAKVCYEVVSPVKMSYCYESIYDGVSQSPSSCSREFDGVQCNSCFVNRRCSTFDCSNIDIPFLDLGNVGTGTTCGNETIWKAVMDEYLLYGAFPCEGGCNLCPGDGFMKNIYNTVTFSPYGEEMEYYCYALNTAALVGYLQEVPGDLCQTLPSLVNEPCGCTTPLVDKPGAGNANNGGGSKTQVGGSKSMSSAAISSVRGGLAIAAAAGSVFSWMMV